VGVRLWNDDEELSGFSSDLSKTGVFFETRKLLEAGTAYHLEFTLETGSFFAECVVARVLRASRQVQPVVKSGAGLRFLGIAEVVRELEGETKKRGLEVDLQDRDRLELIYERDIRRGGLFLPTDRELELEQIVRIELRLPRPHGSIEVRAVVLSLSHDPPGAALQVLDLDQVRGKLAPIVGS
jgi:hypothetical protein